MKKITKAIFPVAGFGTRLLPATKALPKEMLPVVSKPVLQYIVEYAVEAGIDDIIFVTGRGKRAIEDHFDRSFELDQTLVEKGKLALVEEVRRIDSLARFAYVRQALPLGNGHALNCAAHLLSDEAVLVMFGDTLFDAERSPAQQVLDVYERHGLPVVAVSSVGREETDKFGVIGGKDLGNGEWLIEHFVEKPKPSEAPSDLAAVGMYVLTPEIFTILKDLAPSPRGEIELTDAFATYIKSGGRLIAKVIEGEWLDTGDKLGLLKASIKLALKDDALKNDLQKFLFTLTE